jgi:hypothetical protein
MTLPRIATFASLLPDTFPEPVAFLNIPFSAVDEISRVQDICCFGSEGSGRRRAKSSIEIQHDLV